MGKEEYNKQMKQMAQDRICADAGSTLSLEGYSYAFVDRVYYIKGEVDVGSLKYALADDGVDYEVGADNNSLAVGSGLIRWEVPVGNGNIVEVTDGGDVC